MTAIDRRFVVHHDSTYAENNPGRPGLHFIRDTLTGSLVRDKNTRLRSFRKERDAQKACDALNAKHP